MFGRLVAVGQVGELQCQAQLRVCKVNTGWREEDWDRRRVWDDASAQIRRAQKGRPQLLYD